MAVQGRRNKPVVLLTNDDGPPSASSPNIYGFCKLLQERLGWEVKVVIPDCQKSWVGKAYAISEIITASYFYPRGPDGLTGDITTTPRPLRDDETMEWILLAGTPASCTNIALHNIYPGQIDLVISGPNHGRNSSTAFALSSGTLGAALAAALSVPLPAAESSSSSTPTHHIPSIAVSYGVVTRPCPPRATELAHEISVDVCKRLWDDWGYESGSSETSQRRRVQVYSVNVPLVLEKLESEARKVVWTNMWRNNYGRLFKETQANTTRFEPDDDRNQNKRSDIQSTSDKSRQQISSSITPGPNALSTTKPTTPSTSTETATNAQQPQQLKFQFAPSMGPLLFPQEADLPEGSDAWAFAKGYTSVTPIRAEFGTLLEGGCGFASDDGDEHVPGREWGKL